MNKLTPNLIVDRIETCLPFWTKLGFTKTVEVPDGDRLGFAILVNGKIEIMLQTRASMAKDIAPLGEDAHRAFVYIEVDALAPIREALGNAPRIIPERTTFYGANEIIVREPGGHTVVFASHEK
jgi:hypothetical protein